MYQFSSELIYILGALASVVAAAVAVQQYRIRSQNPAETSQRIKTAVGSSLAAAPLELRIKLKKSKRSVSLKSNKVYFFSKTLRFVASSSGQSAALEAPELLLVGQVVSFNKVFRTYRVLESAIICEISGKFNSIEYKESLEFQGIKFEVTVEFLESASTRCVSSASYNLKVQPDLPPRSEEGLEGKFKTIEQSMSDWEEVAQQNFGSYRVVSKSVFEIDKYFISYLTIGNSTLAGIEVTFVTPVVRNNGLERELVTFRGYIYPVQHFFYLIAERTDSYSRGQMKFFILKRGKNSLFGKELLMGDTPTGADQYASRNVYIERVESHLVDDIWDFVGVRYGFINKDDAKLNQNVHDHLA